MSARYIVLGSSNMDLISYTPRIPKEGETIIGTLFETRFGGKGANQAVMISKIVDNPKDVCFISRVGSDDFGKHMISDLNEYGLNTDYVHVTDRCASGVACINIDSKGQNNIIVIPGANFTLTKEDVDSCPYLNSKADIPTYLIIQFEIPLEVNLYALQKAKENGIITIVNPAPAPTIFPLSILPYCDYICPNETESELITGMSIQNKDISIFKENIKRAAQNILEKGAKNIIVTLGKEGSFFMNDSTSFFVQSFPVHCVDTVGAGDCFIGSFTYYLSKHYPIDKCILNANYVASLSVSRSGAQKSYPVKQEIDPKYI
ncbi:hypothetical protein WA158_007120 [Blastocystis sp. Blastoise]